MDLRDVERRIFNLLVASVIRAIPINRWTYNGKTIDLPYAIETTPDRMHVFRCEVQIPKTRFRWFIKFVLSGNALLKVDGESYAGIDECHTYVPIEPGIHSIELIASPRTLFGFHTWSLTFEKAFAVEVAWDVLAFSLQLLELVRFVEELPESDSLKRDLKELLFEVFRDVRVVPTVSQIAIALSLLYEHPLSRYIGRRDLKEPYGDYVWLSGVYGIGVLKGYLQDVKGTDIQDVAKICLAIKDRVYRGLEDLRKKYGKAGIVYIAGHSHIDAAWLWPKRETVEKVLRTFSTVMRLAKEYNIVYVQSSAQYYNWLEEKDPKLFNEIKRLIENGSVIHVGGMWIESDTQLIDGESLARQFLYGQRYFLSRFGKISRIGWIPDSFGFSGNLPQIMRLSGLEVFVTHKVMWNDTNEFPYHAFVWRGIDGTEIPVHILTLTYNGILTPAMVKAYWESYKQKDVVPFALFSYGYGNGGGGPTREMLEYVELINSLPRVPTVVHINEDEYIKKLKEFIQKAPIWNGELYVETHRGTYTTNIAAKEVMAKAEMSIKEVEIISTLLQILGKAKADKKKLDELWKLVLFNQFHDIIPGSSIKEVYSDMVQELSHVVRKLDSMVKENINRLESGGSTALLVFNILPWTRKDVVKIDKSLGVPAIDGKPSECQEAEDSYYVYLDAPSLGYKVYSLGEAICSSTPGVRVYTEDGVIVLENEHLRIAVDRNGNISSIRLKHYDVEVLKEPSNKLIAHIDLPGRFDAWDVTDDFIYQGTEMIIVKPPTISIAGDIVSCVDTAKGFNSSVIEQRICLYKGSPVIEIRNRIRWYDKGVLVKVWFILDAEKTKAFYDIPYGVIERSTARESTWDKAKFEVPAVRWASLYGDGKGLTIIAPSRHGYSAIGNRIGLSLIRSPMYPNPWSDLGEYEITYYIYPHIGDYEEAEVPKIAQQTLYKPKTYYIRAKEEEVSLISIHPPEAMLGALKISEDLDGYILRVYNPYRRRIKVLIKFSKHLKISKALEVNIIETEALRELPVKDGVIEVELDPQRIVTLKLIP